MINRATLVAASLALLVSAVLANEPKTAVKQRKADALDIIPEDVFVAIAIRNVSELTSVRYFYPHLCLAKRTLLH